MSRKTVKRQTFALDGGTYMYRITEASIRRVRRGKRSTYQCLYDHAAGSPCALSHDVYAPRRLQRAGFHRCLQERHALYPFIAWGIHPPGHTFPHGLRPPGTHRSGCSRATAARHPASSQAQVKQSENFSLCLSIYRKKKGVEHHYPLYFKPYLPYGNPYVSPCLIAPFHPSD